MRSRDPLAQRWDMHLPPRSIHIGQCHHGHGSLLELETNIAEDYAKFYNNREGPYWGLLLAKSAD